MSNQLSFVVRSSPICEGEPDAIVDFEIDSESVWQRMRRLEPQLMASPQASNPDGTFVGVSAWIVRGREDAYRTGHHPGYRGRWAGLLPLLACSDCGWEGCGGIWTRIFVGPKRVFWSGLGFSGAGEGFKPVYDPTTFVFDRSDYDATFTALLERIRLAESAAE
ncbi:hypothetical protein HAHE_25890 [Haloferula helveola]|uniref:GNAT family N-acetyltransferase n=1 Tax=Haloferula helveola TaxID=490095 RepID=A0ABM7RMX6_9BACT|nr:hypothetical protein HAHE_24390 [Haloferula helveola]BCX48681.1 hypothetical protein HAHE_25890 [Haloferula helveola]